MTTQDTQSGDNHLLVIDGLNVVRRVYEANPAPDSVEKAEAAMRNSVASFRRALEEHNPTHVLAPFDFGGHTWRHDLYPDYRKSRSPMPQELRDVLPALLLELNLMGIATIQFPGVEADDVVAAVVLRWMSCGKGTATVLSTDKDLGELVAHGARIWDHFAGHWRDEAWFDKKFGVRPDQLHDALAMIGDKTDDIPGIPSIGVKTAAKLLKTYNSLEEMLAQADSIQGSVGEKVRANIELVKLSRQLVAFRTDMKLGLTWNMLRYAAEVPA